jgi:hypothetical protein
MQIAFHTKKNLYKDDSYSLIVILKYNNLTFYINELGDNADAVLIASQDMGFRILILMLILITDDTRWSKSHNQLPLVKPFKMSTTHVVTFDKSSINSYDIIHSYDFLDAKGDLRPPRCNADKSCIFGVPYHFFLKEKEGFIKKFKL